jgi:hypothetical protein
MLIGANIDLNPTNSITGGGYGGDRQGGGGYGGGQGGYGGGGQSYGGGGEPFLSI